MFARRWSNKQEMESLARVNSAHVGDEQVAVVMATLLFNMFSEKMMEAETLIG